MPKFIIKTWETVEGTYEVEASDIDTARKMFERDWQRVGEQTSYEAFDMQVKSIFMSSEDIREVMRRYTDL